MSAATHETEHHTSLGLDNRKLLMWIFLASECLFFGSLLSTYLIFKGESLSGPGTDIFAFEITSISTFVLLMSSLSMVLAVYGAQHGQLGLMKLMLLCTILLGLVFLGFQVYEFKTFASEGLTLSTNQFGASFFLLTGFHGCHVGGGVIYLTSLLISSVRRNGIGKETPLYIDIGGLYWHFVDIVWIVLFTVVYLIPAY
ncbi:MAG: cytochrome c oxidase subunit 3 [SAR202 cluster bacterium]|nr:cytochrome c oxidase subunit 3 [SAR202 cluster bacterium]